MFKISLFSSALWPFQLILMTVWLCSCFSTLFVSSRCLDDQKTLLLELKNNLTFSPMASDKLVGWNESTNCCQWSGVECDNSNGRVIGLDLSERNITGGISNSSSLFRLQFLQRLNLGGNKEMQGEILPAFGKLSSLTYLNLSKANFSGQVPLEISQLVKLVVLDISITDPDEYEGQLQMKRPNLRTIVRNMTNMRELYLNGVNNSAMGIKWCEALSSSLPHLQVLSMSYCDLNGEIHKSLSNLNRLSVIILDGNDNLTGPVPEFLADFANLTKLSVSYTAITGTVPTKIFQIPTLRSLSLAANSILQGTLPEFSKNGSLEELVLGGITFSSSLTSSITNLKKLRILVLIACQFHGRIPISIGSLERLEKLYLPNNQFEGPIPKEIFRLKELESLDLASNRLNGTLQLSEILLSFKKLRMLSLSNNFLSINTDGSDVNSSFPQLESLSLGSCNLHSIPEFLKNQSQLFDLDLSKNHIRGTIPGWMWAISTFDLSNNHFMKLEPPLRHSVLTYVHLQSNNLQGEFPFLLSSPRYLDCSKNNFTSIHPNISNNASSAKFISFSRNSLYGSIPASLCTVTRLGILNLEYNHLGGTIPDCLFAMPQLFVLNLRGNRLGGNIPDKFTKGCFLQTLQLNKNLLRGRIPPSLAHCNPMEVLDVGYNQLNDTFPCHLKSLSHLKVLILRSNKFHGTMLCLKGHSIWPLLQVIDLALNNFSGELSAYFALKWKSMMAGTAGTSAVQPKQPEYLINNYQYGYYQISVTIASKGLSSKQYILTIFSCIDVSNNAFYGKLPTQMGNLNALKVLNLSHNFFSGHIPPSLGNLSRIESLDLSCNAFNGRIPPQLANLNFLEYLNLSYNKLSGRIPTGTQLQTFDDSSYKGNQGLYGPPLTLDRPDPTRLAPSRSTKGSSWSAKDQIEWMMRGAEVGFPVGITIFLGPLLYIKRYRDWYCKHLHRLVMKILRKEDSPKGERRSRRQQGQRR